ncbi:YbdK family carboxylate-amine ligase [Arcobacter sp. LA11]|uniref:carboxylate-amine ligase n=1 Tax=Arcobacter sp. LA11 TaxID=1898176 RepID=UPI000933C2E7|nr:YbdK family carboxylate-amine ligase [Arcobacter sp. LA11]
MKFEKFDDGNHFTIGVELELRILDKYKLSLQNEYDYIFSNINDKYKKNLASEFLGSMVEINTPIFHYEKDLIDFLKEIISDMNGVVKKKNLNLQTSGTYAQENSNTKVNSCDRYEKLYNEHQILLDNFSICGTHVHVGFEDFDKALKAYNYSLYYLPLFVALSASSVFFNNTDSGIHSYRTKIFDRLPKASIPDYFDSYDEMKAVYDLLYENKVINSTKDIWWDVRIQPHFRTLEFRVCDAVNDFDRLEVIIALFKAICQLSQIEELTKMPMQVLKQNMWSATRYSMSGSMITKDGLISIRELLNNLIDKAYEKSFLSKEMSHRAKKIVLEKSISEQMIEVYNRTESLKEVERLGVFE